MAKKLRGFSHIINVQGDEPLVDPALISKLAAALAADRKIEMITSASVFAPDDDLAQSERGEGRARSRGQRPLFFPLRRSRTCAPTALRPHFYRHQGIYGYTTKFLLQFVKWKPGILEQAESLEQLRALENGAQNPRRAREARRAWASIRRRMSPPSSACLARKLHCLSLASSATSHTLNSPSLQ